VPGEEAAQSRRAVRWAFVRARGAAPRPAISAPGGGGGFRRPAPGAGQGPPAGKRRDYRWRPPGGPFPAGII